MLRCIYTSVAGLFHDHVCLKLLGELEFLSFALAVPGHVTHIRDLRSKRVEQSGREPSEDGQRVDVLLRPSESSVFNMLCKTNT